MFLFIYFCQEQIAGKNKTEKKNTKKNYIDLKVKLARKAKETTEAYEFGLPHHSLHDFRLRHGFSGRV